MLHVRACVCLHVNSASDLLQERHANLSQGLLEEERRGTRAADAINIPSDDADALHSIVRTRAILQQQQQQQQEL